MYQPSDSNKNLDVYHLVDTSRFLLLSLGWYIYVFIIITWLIHLGFYYYHLVDTSRFLLLSLGWYQPSDSNKNIDVSTKW
jgi:hypothetical protein